MGAITGAARQIQRKADNGNDLDPGSLRSEGATTALWMMGEVERGAMSRGYLDRVAVALSGFSPEAAPLLTDYKDGFLSVWSRADEFLGNHSIGLTEVRVRKAFDRLLAGTPSIFPDEDAVAKMRKEEDADQRRGLSEALQMEGVTSPHFFRYRQIDRRKIWPHLESGNVFHFEAGVVVTGGLACVREIVFNAAHYDDFIERVTSADWILEPLSPPISGSRDGIVKGVIAGRYGLSDRVSALRMWEEEVAPTAPVEAEAHVFFDTYQGDRSLNRSRLSADDLEDRVQADTAGAWFLYQYADDVTLVRYWTTPDINTWVPNWAVATAIPDDSSEVFRAILNEVKRRCSP